MEQELEWMDQPVQQWQAGPDGGGDGGDGGDGAAAGAESAGDTPDGDAGGGEGGAAEPSLADAIAAGIDEADGKPAKPAGDDDAAAGDGKAGEADAGSEGPGGDPKGDGDGDGKEGKNKEGEPDPVNDPIPEEVKGRTRERMEALVGKVKETSTQLEQVQGQYDEMMGYIQETGASPEQYGLALQYLGAVNQAIESRDPKDAEAALEILEQERTVLYELAGKSPPGDDPLADHQDLRDEVETQDISMERALEIARARNAQKRQEQAQQTQQQRDQQTRQQEAAAVNTAKTALNEIGKTLAATDPNYKAKVAQIMPAVKEKLKTAPPDKWVDLFRDAYAKAEVKPAATPGNGKPPNNDQQPLHGRPRAGGQTKAPGSMAEAIDAGIADASR